jgi:hypothetical protein
VQVIDAVLSYLPTWESALNLPPSDVTALRRYLEGERDRLMQARVAPAERFDVEGARAARLELIQLSGLLTALPQWVRTGWITEAVREELAVSASARGEELRASLVDAPSTQPPDRDQRALAQNRFLAQIVEDLHTAGHLVDEAAHRAAATQYSTAIQDLEAEVRAPAVAPKPAPPKPAPKPPKPKRPPIDWGKAWDRVVEAAVSGALLRGLLYLGAFMIVVSAYILVVLFWDIFSQGLQLVFIASVPTAFYLAGWGVRAQLKLPQAGGVLTGIGALLVAADFAAVYQFGGLSELVDGNLYWLGASLFCTAVYAITAWRLPGEFFDYISLIGGGSGVLALTRLFNLPIEWSVVSITASSVGMIGGAAYLKRASERWNDFGLAARRLPQILIPATMAVVPFAPQEAALGKTLTFALAALGYVLLAWQFPAVIFVHGAVWSLVAAVGFGVWGSGLSLEWYGTVAVLLSSLYILSSSWLTDRLSDDFAPKRAYLTALQVAGFGALLLAVLAGLATLAFDLWAGVICLALAALLLAGAAYLLRRPILTLLAGGLFIVPFSFSLNEWLLSGQAVQQVAWLMAAWTGLALAYLGIAALLRTADRYARWLYLWAHILAPLAAIGLLAEPAINAGDWSASPSLVALGGAILVYLASALLHDSGRHAALSDYVSWLPDEIGVALFLWPVGLLLPIWLTVFWSVAGVGWPWLGPALAGLALVYVALGQLLARRKAEYRLPPHAYAYVLGVIAALVAWSDTWALMISLYINILVLAALAFTHRRVIETSLAALLFIWPFQLSLDLSPLTPHAHSLAYTLLVGLGYIPLGILLKRVGRPFALPVNLIEWALAAFALVSSLLGRFGFWPVDIPSVGVVVPLLVTGMQVFNLYRFRQSPFAWAAALTFAIGYGQLLTLLRVPPEYDAVAWVGLAFAYLLAERVLARIREDAWVRQLRWPLGIGATALCTLGLLLTTPNTILAFGGEQLESCFPLILAQTLCVGFVVLAARLYRSRWPLYLEPWLAFLPVTLFFIGYGGAIFGQPLTTPQYGIVWSALGLLHLLVGALLDRVEIRYARGPYLGGYVFAIFAVLWTLANRSSLLWTLGLGILAAIGSALLVHFKHHRTWDELIAALFGEQRGTARSAVRGAFLWLVAWPFPAWCVLLLQQLGVGSDFQWLGLGIPALLLLGLAVWLRRAERTYAWPFHTSAQFYTLLGLFLSMPLTARLLTAWKSLPDEVSSGLAFILLQALAVAFYAASARALKYRLFAHVAAWLSFFPYTLAWIVYRPAITQAQFAWPWVGWAAVLLAVGFALDRTKGRYSHGPYLAGYVLAGFALVWSVPERLANLYTLAGAILLALVSQVLVHSGRHRSFDDLVQLLLRRARPEAQRAARTVFLFFAVYAFPVLVAQLLTYHGVGLAWRGTALALLAPLYVAFGLAARRVKPEYAWPLYSAGYALTAIGTMITFDNLELAIYVLALDALVYAVSAYIFGQSFWLYLSNTLVPVIALLTLRFNAMLSPPWVSGILMGLAFLYLALGQWFDRRQRGQDSGLSSYALPFYVPGYLLSAVALAVASGERTLAIAVYSAGTALYSLSAWMFREAIFVYPAAWLAAVPYYLGMTLTPLDPRWYGLGWLPLIVGYIGLGRFVFHKEPLGIKGLRSLVDTLARPAMPFYLLAYGLSVSMVVLSQADPLILTLALVAGAAVYCGSALLFRRPAWLYPGLLAAHLALISYFTIDPSGGEIHDISLPFLGVTWLMALVGYWLSRRFPVDRPSETGGRIFKLWRWELEFGNWPFVGYLITPSWAQSVFNFAALDLVLWQAVALGSHNTAIILAAGNMLLLGLLATLWQDSALVYASLGFLLLGAGYGLDWAGVGFVPSFAWVGGIGFALYLVARVAKQTKAAALSVWLRPLTNTASFLTGLAVLVTLPAVAVQTTAAAAALAFAGALYLAIAYRGRYHYLGYVGMAMLQLAWVLALIVNDVRQPQGYAIPAGLYFAGAGYLERKRGRGLFAIIVESFGLAVLLVTSFIQSLDGAQGFPYFLLLLVEGLLVIWWGVWRRLRIPFFIGLGASAFNVVAQVVVLVNVYDVNRWFVFLGVGLLLVATAVYIERKREQIISRAQEWWEDLEAWE